MINLFDRYVLKILAMATTVTALSLTLIILLTQSIRYLELVISSDASALYFLLMIALAIPKFLEAILPLSFVIGCLYTMQRLMNDREMVIMAASGAKPTTAGKGFILFAAIMMVFQFLLSGWGAPMAVSALQQTRSDVKSQYATLMFREGIFTTLGNGLTVYVEDRPGLNELSNVMINDDKGTLNNGQKTTILAKRGIVNLRDDLRQLLIYDGTQYIEKNNGSVSRLDFSQYTLDIPVSADDVVTRWREPDERRFHNLFIAHDATGADGQNRNSFIAEIHKRIATPFLYASYTAIILYYVLMGKWNRRSMTRPLIITGFAVIVIQASFIILFNEAQKTTLLNGGLYAIAICPALLFGLLIRQRQKVS